MITDNRMRTLARQDGVTAGLAEKNYVNSWVLYAIYTSGLGENLVFKGGTALSKLYFPELWRFSEDLDFTATAKVDIERLEEALTEIEALSGIQFEIINIHEAGEPVGYIQVDVQYDAVLGQQNTTKLDITLNEELAFDTVTHSHSFEDVPQFKLEAYSIEEILVEKFRSLYQRSRARDYYDIYRLLNQESFDKEKIVEGLQLKAEQQGVQLDLETGIPEEDTEDVHNYWDKALNRLVTEKPEFEEVVSRINRFLYELAEEK